MNTILTHVTNELVQLKLQRRENIYLMLRRVKSAKCSKQPVNESGVVLPTLKLLLKGVEFTALRIKLEQATLHQIIQTWGLYWGHQRRSGGVHLH